MIKRKLTQNEIENIIDDSINISIISRLLKLNLINEKQFYILKEKIKTFNANEPLLVYNDSENADKFNKNINYESEV